MAKNKKQDRKQKEHSKPTDNDRQNIGQDESDINRSNKDKQATDLN